MRRQLILALLLIAACKQQPADQASSWVATLQFTGEQWLANSVPSSFVRSTIDSADGALEKAASDRTDIAHDVANARDAARDLKQAIDRNDRRAVATAVQRMAAIHQSLERFQSP